MAKNDGSTSVQALKNVVRKFCEARDWDQYHGPKDLAIGVSTEASELLEHFRFKSDRQALQVLADPKKRREVGEELADVLYFLLRFAQMHGFDLSQELSKKMRINGKKYPLGKSKGRNLKYTEL